MNTIPADVTIAGLRDKVDRLRRQVTQVVNERDDARDKLDLCKTKLQAAMEEVTAKRTESAELRRERDEARAALDRVQELAEEMAGLAPGDDWGDDVPSTIGADVARQFLAALDGSGM